MEKQRIGVGVHIRCYARKFRPSPICRLLEKQRKWIAQLTQSARFKPQAGDFKLPWPRKTLNDSLHTHHFGVSYGLRSLLGILEVHLDLSL